MSKFYYQLKSKLDENKEDWYYLCNDAEQALFKVKAQCKDESAIKSLERMIIDLNSIRMEQYERLTEYSLVEEVVAATNLDLDNMANELRKHFKNVNNKDYIKKSLKMHLDKGLINKDEYNTLSKEYKLNEEFWNDAGEKEYKGIKISIEKGDHGNTCYIPLRNKELNFIPEDRTQFFSWKEVKEYIDSKLSNKNLKESFKGNFEGKKIKIDLHNDKSNPVWIVGDISIDNKTYRVNAKVFLEDSEFGIENGPVSKLWIADSKGDWIINYDRGWDVKPTAETEEIYNIALGAVRSFRNDNPYEPDLEPEENIKEAADPNEEIVNKAINYIENEYNEIGTDDRYFLLSKLKGRGNAINKIKKALNYMNNEYNELGSDDRYFLTNILSVAKIEEPKEKVKEEPKERAPRPTSKKAQVLETFNNCLNRALTEYSLIDDEESMSSKNTIVKSYKDLPYKDFNASNTIGTLNDGRSFAIFDDNDVYIINSSFEELKRVMYDNDEDKFEEFMNKNSERADDKLEAQILVDTKRIPSEASDENLEEYSATIYQIKDISNCSYAFREYDEAKNKINMDDYEAVASIVLPKKGSTNDLLEQIFMLGNTDKDRFNVYGEFRSISVSDIIELENEVYYVDSFGFKKIR